MEAEILNPDLLAGSAECHTYVSALYPWEQLVKGMRFGKRSEDTHGVVVVGWDLPFVNGVSGSINPYNSAYAGYMQSQAIFNNEQYFAYCLNHDPAALAALAAPVLPVESEVPATAAEATMASATPSSATPETAQVMIDFYDQYGAALNSCIKQEFGNDAQYVPTQTIWNAPYFDHTKPIADLTAMNPQGIPAMGQNAAFLGAYGTVYVASEYWTYQDMLSIFGTYAHELGNILDIKLANQLGSPMNGMTYGDPLSKIDMDTGQAIEKCIFP